jgi:hypothetical protein
VHDDETFDSKGRQANGLSNFFADAPNSAGPPVRDDEIFDSKGRRAVGLTRCFFASDPEKKYSTAATHVEPSGSPFSCWQGYLNHLF